jgi:glycosyltransferase involved in cell wall biosynthesis
MAKSEKGIRVLYVCPWAHHAGHYPQAVIKEPSALFEAGAQISVCTFKGILDEKEPQIIPHRTVVSGWLGFPVGILTKVLHFTPGARTLADLSEFVATSFLAVKLRKSLRYDIIYLRDGDPFIFVPFLLGLVSKHHRWAISLMGIVRERPSASLPYRLINSPIWKPIYRRGFSKNRFVFLCQNTHIKDYFETKFLQGMLSGRVRVVPMGVEKTTIYIPRKEAREYLGLQEDKVVFLHFGALHPGKDILTVLNAIKDVPNVLLIHAGKVTSSIDLINLVQHYSLEDRVIIKDYYIPEAEKQYYFAAADAMILSYKRDFSQTASLLWEAARFNLPAIASDSGELGQLVKKYKIGLVFKAEDVASLRDAISHFLVSNQSER